MCVVCKGVCAGVYFDKVRTGSASRTHTRLSLKRKIISLHEFIFTDYVPNQRRICGKLAKGKPILEAKISPPYSCSFSKRVRQLFKTTPFQFP